MINFLQDAHKHNDSKMNHMPTTNFKVKYDGEALIDHEMDVAVLAPALMGLARLVEEATKISTGGEYNAKLKIQGNPKAGSIEIWLTVDPISNISQLKEMLIGNSSMALANLGGIIGLVYSVIGLLKWLRGGTPDKLKKNEDGTIDVSIRNETITINQYTYNLYVDFEVRRNIYKVLEPLETDGIESFILKDDKHIVEVTDTELPYFISSIVENKLNESIAETILIIEAITFKEKNKWSFYDGSQSIKASILDENFLEEIEKGKRFAKGDWLKVLLRKVQIEENGNLKTTYEVMEVIEHIVKEQYKLDIK